MPDLGGLQYAPASPAVARDFAYLAGQLGALGMAGAAGGWYHRQESNLYLALRRRSFYPLNYGGEGQGIVIADHSGVEGDQLGRGEAQAQ